MARATVQDEKAALQRQMPTTRKATTVALVYAGLGCLSIVSSGWLLHRLVQNEHVEQLFKYAKGWFFVGATAVLLWAALERLTFGGYGMRWSNFRTVRNACAWWVTTCRMLMSFNTCEIVTGHHGSVT